jgi:hypothetical protein
MSTQTQLSRYGAISRPVDVPIGAKLFLVSDSDDTTVGPVNLGAEFPVDNDGVVRVYTTIQAGVNAAAAGRGDVVAVLPGYDHTLGRADSWATAGVQVIGLGQGLNRPIVRYTGIADEVGIAANNVRVSNLRFLAAGDSVVRALDLDTGFSGARVDHCLFDFSANLNNFETMVRVGQARAVIEDNEFWAEDTAGAGKGVELLGGYADFLKVRRNFFYGQFDTVGDTTNNAAAIAIAVAHDSGDTVLSGFEIAENTIVSTDTAATVMVQFTATGVSPIRGLIRDNRFASYDTAALDTASIVFGGTAGPLSLQNWYVDGDSDVYERLIGRPAAKFIGQQDDTT